MALVSSTEKNTTFLAQFNSEAQLWKIMDTDFRTLFTVPGKQEVELFVQQYCKKNYIPQDSFCATIYWSDGQLAW